MSDIQEVLEEFLTNYNKLNSISQKKNSELSKVDLEISDYYHKIEGIHLSHNTQGHGLILELKGLLGRRRELKREVILLRSFIDTTQQSMSTAKSRGVKILKKHDNLIKNMKNNAKKLG